MIKSWEGLAKDFFFLDTGSTDGTLDVLNDYGVVWEKKFDNFVDDKNYLLEKVSKLKYIDWIIWSDGKEYLSPVMSKEEITHELENVAKNDDVFFSTSLLCLDNDDKLLLLLNRPRIWKNKLGYKYEGPGVHEYLRKPDNAVERKLDGDGVLHKRDFIDVKETSKNDLYINLLTAHLEKEPSNTRAWFYLGRTYMDTVQYQKAIDTYGKYIATCFDINYHFKAEEQYALFEMGIAYKELNNLDTAVSCFTNCIMMVDNWEAPHCQIAKIYDMQGIKSVEIKQHLKRSDEILESELYKGVLFWIPFYQNVLLPELNKKYGMPFVYLIETDKKITEKSKTALETNNIKHDVYKLYPGQVFNALANPYSKFPTQAKLTGYDIALYTTILSIFKSATINKINNFVIITDNMLEIDTLTTEYDTHIEAYTKVSENHTECHVYSNDIAITQYILDNFNYNFDFSYYCSIIDEKKLKGETL
jgi:tetratricopeptide (TPR) repeat protein